MASYYWDDWRWGSTTSTTSTTSEWMSNDSTTSTTSSTSTNRRWVTYSSNDPSTHYYQYAYRPERCLVETPAHWTRDNEVAAFIRLVNLETATGWKINMVINGDVAIVDPDVQKRSMADFLPMLRNHASAEDVAKIAEFLKAHPIEPPAA